MRPLLLLAPLCLALPLGAATDRPLKSFPEAQLKEAPAGSEVLFVVSGDNRPTAQGAPLPPVLKTIFAEIGLIRPDFVIWTGDTVYGSCDSREELEYQAFAAAAAPIAGTVPLFNAPCQPYGSFDLAGAHFIALHTDGAADAISGTQLAWLKRDLESNKGARAIFVFTHTKLNNSLQDLFRRYSVKAVFSGHEHISRYVVVRLVGDKVSYDVIEPGRLSLEIAPSVQNEARLWIVNSNDTAQPLPIRGIEIEPPLTPKRCEGLIATAALKKGDAWVLLDGVTVDGCAVTGGALRLHVKVPPLPQGSVLVTVRRNGTDGRPVS